jgi:hypothetical protein
MIGNLRGSYRVASTSRRGTYGRHPSRTRRALGKNVCSRDAVLQRVSGRILLRFSAYVWPESRIPDRNDKRLSGTYDG